MLSRPVEGHALGVVAGAEWVVLELRVAIVASRFVLLLPERPRRVLSALQNHLQNIPVPGSRGDVHDRLVPDRSRVTVRTPVQQRPDHVLVRLLHG